MQIIYRSQYEHKTNIIADVNRKREAKLLKILIIVNKYSLVLFQKKKNQLEMIIIKN